MPENEDAIVDARTGAFLDVEDVARTLAARLERLDDEANRYATAAAKLDGAANSALELTNAVQDVGRGVEKAIAVIASVGGPEIVQRLSDLEAAGAVRAEALLKKVSLAVMLSAVAAALAFVAALIAAVR